MIAATRTEYSFLSLKEAYLGEVISIVSRGPPQAGAQLITVIMDSHTLCELPSPPCPTASFLFRCFLESSLKQITCPNQTKSPCASFSFSPPLSSALLARTTTATPCQPHRSRAVSIPSTMCLWSLAQGLACLACWINVC